MVCLCLLSQVYQTVLRVVRVEVAGRERSIGELVAVLMMHVDTFPSHTLVTLVDEYVEMVRSGEPLQGRYVLLRWLYKASLTYLLTIQHNND